MLSLHQRPFYFCMNQFHKFHHSELRNWIYVYLKTQGIRKLLVRKEDGSEILLKNGTFKT